MLGVITKADTVEPSHHEYWTKIIKNEIHKLNHGYYVTCLSFSDAEGYDNDQLRTREREFFSSSHPIWSECPPRRLGSDKLAEALSRRLHKMIVTRHPLSEKKAYLLGFQGLRRPS